MSDEPAFTDHSACFGDLEIGFQRNRDGEVKDILFVWKFIQNSPLKHPRFIPVDFYSELTQILTALKSDFPELISNCKDIKDL